MIRHANLRDIPRLVDLGREFIASTPQYRAAITPNDEAIAKSIELMVSSLDALVLVYERDGQVVGMIGMVASMHPFSGAPVVSEMFWYVQPDHRGPSGIRLHRCAEAWARDNGAEKIIMVSPSKKISRYYRARSYQRIEEQFIKDLTS